MEFEVVLDDENGGEWKITYDAAVSFGKYTVTDEGYLRVKGTAAAAGNMTYTNAADGTKIVDHVPGEVLERAAPLLKNMPVTLEHPPIGLLDSKTVKEYQVGEVVDSVYNADEEANDVELIVRDHEAVQAVLSRRVTGLSPGYHVRRRPADEGLDAQRVQVDRKYNHLALTAAPRRGERTSVRLDSEGHAIFEPPIPEKGMDPEETNDGVENTPTPNQSANLDALAGAIQALNVKFDNLAQRLEPTEEKEETAGDSAPKFDLLAEVKAYNRAVKAATKLGVDYNEATDSTKDIERKIASKFLGEDVATDASDAYIAGVMAMVGQAPSEDPMDDVADSFGFNRPAKRKDTEVEVDSYVDPTALEHSRGRKSTPRTEVKSNG